MVLIIITGPPTFGKMVIGLELGKLMGYKLFKAVFSRRII